MSFNISPPSTPRGVIARDNRENNQLPTPTTPSTATFPSLSVNKRNLQDEFTILDLLLPTESVTILDNNAVIGNGSHSRVYLCHVQISNTSLNGDLCIKVPLNKYLSKLLQREALMLQKLKSNEGDDQFVSIIGVVWLNNSINEDEKFGLVLQKLDFDLENLINTHTSPVEGQLRIGKHLWWSLYKTLIQLLRTMKQSGIVHCDLKTSNILFDKHNNVFKICDLSSLQQMGTLSSKPETTLQFMAPELLSNTNERNSYHTDLYSAGLILLHALTGKLPYDGFCSGNSSALMIQLMSLIKKNSVLRLLDDHSMEIMRNNCDVWELLNNILMKRCDLEELV